MLPEPDTDEHPVSAEAERRVRRLREYRALHAESLALAAKLADLLDDEVRDLWLRADAAIHHCWAMTADEYFNLGVEHGLAHRVADDVLSDAGVDPELDLAAAVRALAAALVRVAERLP